MPDFARAQITDPAAALPEYRGFLQRLTVGQVVTIPLAPGERPRGVMQRLNAAAQQASLRLRRLSSEQHAVRFKVAPAQKRAVNLSVEARIARAKKAQATRAARKHKAQKPR